MSNEMKRNAYDAIIIGAGHNGLVAAAFLARAGLDVLVLEQREVVGGAAAAEEIFPGVQADIGAHDVSLFDAQVASDLFLPMYGLTFSEPEAALFAPAVEGPGRTLWRDSEKTTRWLARVNPRDAQRYPEFVAEMEHMVRLVREMMVVAPPSLTEVEMGDLWAWGKVGLRLKQMGDRPMMRFMQILPMSVQEYLDEWFEDEAFKGMLGAAGIAGSELGPRAAGTNLLFLYQFSQGFPGTRYVTGGMGQFSASLTQAATSAGVEIHTATPVAAILAPEGQATGVRLADGTEIKARVVVSNADPQRTLFGLLGPQHLSPQVMKQVRHIRFRGTSAKVLLALNGLPAFQSQPEEVQLRGRIRIAPDLEYLERAHDDAKYGRISAQPYLEMVIPTLQAEAGPADGQHLLSITMQYAPYELAEGQWDERRADLYERVVTTLQAYAPGIDELITQWRVFTPLDWQQSLGLTEGSIYQGQMGLDQLLVMRPIPGWSRYQTPVGGLYLCGAGAHPGGGVTGLPGRNAAREILKNLGG